MQPHMEFCKIWTSTGNVCISQLYVQSWELQFGEKSRQQTSTTEKHCCVLTTKRCRYEIPSRYLRPKGNEFKENKPKRTRLSARVLLAQTVAWRPSLTSFIQPLLSLSKDDICYLHYPTNLNSNYLTIWI